MNLRIDLQRLREGDETLVLDDATKLFDLDDDDWHFEGRITGELTFHMQGEDVFATGQLRARARGRCGRCLEEVPVEVTVPFDYIYQPKDQEPRSDVAIEHVTEGGPETAYYRGDAIDPLDQIRESILLALPVLPERRADETCLHCGRDLAEPAHREDWPDEAPAQEPEWKRRLRDLRGG